MEIGSEKNSARVNAVYVALISAANSGHWVSPQADLVCQVELLSQEVNSGASFEQYFRWVRVTDDSRVLQYLDELGLPEVRGIVERALTTAFPEGIPQDDDAYDSCTDWSESQLRQLAELFGEFERYNGILTNRLGQFIANNDPSVFDPADQAAPVREASANQADAGKVLARLIQVLDPGELGEIQRIAWTARHYEASIMNGGHWRHFIDSDDRDQSQVINALRQIGAGEQAELLAQAVSRVPQGLSMSAAFEQWLEGADISGLEDLDAAFFACGVSLEEHLIRYLSEHPEEFN